MKAKFVNGMIVSFDPNPNFIETEEGISFVESADKETWEAYGYYDIVDTVLSEFEIYGAVVWDEKLGLFVREKINIPAPILTNEQIANQRQQAYKMESDSLYIAAQKYTALGKTENAEAKRIAWLSKVAEIDAKYPYN